MYAWSVDPVARAVPQSGVGGAERRVAEWTRRLHGSSLQVGGRRVVSQWPCMRGYLAAITTKI